MNGAVGQGRILSALLAAALLLTAVAWLRGAEYDEQYTLFLTGVVARPAWPAGVITAGEVRDLQSAHAGVGAIARDLRRTDVHPPLYFWAVAEWRRLVGNSLFAARMASVLFSVVTLSLVAAIARSGGIPVVPAVLLTVGCYGFAYTGAIARGFALAQMLSVAGIAVLLGAERRASRMLAAGDASRRGDVCQLSGGIHGMRRAVAHALRHCEGSDAAIIDRSVQLIRDCFASPIRNPVRSWCHFYRHGRACPGHRSWQLCRYGVSREQARFHVTEQSAYASRSWCAP